MTSIPLDEALRRSGSSPDTSTIEAYLRDTSRELLNAALPRDVHRRYESIRAEQSAVISTLTQEIQQTLASTTAGQKILSGKVAEKVTEGLLDLTSHQNYTHGVGSIGR